MTGSTRTRSDVKREAIIQAATQAFQEYGVNGTSMDKLAELANVSKRTVYNHFATKEDLVMHLITKQFEEAKLSITVEYDSSRDLSEQLCELILQDIEEGYNFEVMRRKTEISILKNTIKNVSIMIEDKPRFKSRTHHGITTL